MDLHEDFEDLCFLLNARQVEYLIVGGYAVAFHGAPRFTGDLDVFILPDPPNVVRLLEAVRDFGFPADPKSADYLVRESKILQLGRIPVQVHVMTKISGVSWTQAMLVPAGFFLWSVLPSPYSATTAQSHDRATGALQLENDESVVLIDRQNESIAGFWTTPPLTTLSPFDPSRPVAHTEDVG